MVMSTKDLIKLHRNLIKTHSREEECIPVRDKYSSYILCNKCGTFLDYTKESYCNGCGALILWDKF